MWCMQVSAPEVAVRQMVGVAMLPAWHTKSQHVCRILMRFAGWYELP